MYEVAMGAKTENGPHAAIIIIGSKRPEADIRVLAATA